MHLFLTPGPKTIAILLTAVTLIIFEIGIIILINNQTQPPTSTILHFYLVTIMVLVVGVVMVTFHWAWRKYEEDEDKNVVDANPPHYQPSVAVFSRVAAEGRRRDEVAYFGGGRKKGAGPAAEGVKGSGNCVRVDVDISRGLGERKPCFMSTAIDEGQLCTQSRMMTIYQKIACRTRRVRPHR